MTNQRANFTHKFFQFLGQKDYIWLKAVHDSPEQVGKESDFDMLVRENDKSDILRFVTAQEEVMHFEMKKGPSALYLSLIFNDGTFLKIDLLTRLVRKQWTYLTNEYLFQNRTNKNGVTTYHSEVLLEHVLLFNFLNHSALPKKYIDHFTAMPAFEQELLVSFINGKYGTQFTSISDMGKPQSGVRTAFLDFLKKMEANAWPKRQSTGLSYLRSKIKTWQSRKNEVITFSGVDGAGKTTLLNDLKNVLAHQFQRKVVVLRHRPSVLPILSAWTKGKAAAEQKAATTLPRQGSNQSKLSSSLRLGYYYLDYLLGQFYVWLRYTLTGHTIIYDRYYFDFIVDGKRSNISLGEGLPKWLYRFVFKPELNVFLYASPDVIRQRKQELPADDIEQMTGRYRQLFDEFAGRYEGQYLCLENLDRQQSLRTILAHLRQVNLGEDFRCKAHPQPLKGSTFPQKSALEGSGSPLGAGGERMKEIATTV